MDEPPPPHLAIGEGARLWTGDPSASSVGQSSSPATRATQSQGWGQIVGSRVLLRFGCIGDGVQTIHVLLLPPTFQYNVLKGTHNVFFWLIKIKLKIYIYIQLL